MAIVLTKPQRESVEYDAGDLLVKGVPGSGKSVVLLQRALRYNKKAIEAHESPKILILAFTKSLVKYTRELVDMTKINPCMIEISTIDKLCYSLFLKMTNKHSAHMITKSEERNAIIDQAIQSHLEKTGKKHRFHGVEVDFWSDEFLWIKQKNITSEAQYIAAERTGRGGKVRMTREDRSIAYAFFNEYCALMKSGRKYDWEDLYTYLIANEHNIPQHEKYDFILVDEAQDLSFAKLKVAKILTKKSITIAADKAQKIYSTSFSWKDLGIDIRGRASKSLDKTFRSTKQIVQLAESLLEFNRALQEDQSEYTSPVFPERDGTVPFIIGCHNAAAEQEFVIKLIKKHLAEHEVIGVLYRSWSEGSTLRRWFITAGIPFEEIIKDSEWSLSSPGVKLSTLHSSKGLEFDTVFIPQFKSSRFPFERAIANADPEQIEEIKAQERSLLYVGMTRAKYDLYLTFSGIPSPYLKNFQPEFYRYISDRGSELPKPQREKLPTTKHMQFSSDLFSASTTSDSSSIQDGSRFEAHEKGKNEIRSFTVDLQQFPIQSAYIGKKVGDTIKVVNKELIICKIY